MQLPREAARRAPLSSKRRIAGAPSPSPRVPELHRSPYHVTCPSGQPASPHATAFVPIAIRSPWAAASSLELSLELTPICFASQICQSRTLNTMSGACGGPYYNAQYPQHPQRVDVVLRHLVSVSERWRAARRPWRPEMSSRRWRFGDSNSEGQERLWSGAADD